MSKAVDIGSPTFLKGDKVMVGGLENNLLSPIRGNIGFGDKNALMRG